MQPSTHNLTRASSLSGNLSRCCLMQGLTPKYSSHPCCLETLPLMSIPGFSLERQRTWSSTIHPMLQVGLLSSWQDVMAGSWQTAGPRHWRWTPCTPHSTPLLDPLDNSWGRHRLRASTKWWQRLLPASWDSSSAMHWRCCGAHRSHATERERVLGEGGPGEL